jgi:hypothetical protein
MGKGIERERDRVERERERGIERERALARAIGYAANNVVCGGGS